ALGIGMVHQHFMLVPRFSVLENVILGEEPSNHGVIDFATARKRVRELCERYDMTVDVDSPVSELSVGQQQRVEIIKVLYRGAGALVLDEPTAVLTPREVEELFRSLRHLRDQGKAIVFISHKLDEVIAIADRVTVLRRGRVVGSATAAELTKARLAEMMVGRPVLLEVEKPPKAPGEVALQVERLMVHGSGKQLAVRGLSFAVRRGEIYGIAGVEGNGQAELVEAIMGLRPVAGGAVRVLGRDIAGFPVGRIRRLGVAYVPEDRHKRGLILTMTVWENGILGQHRLPSFAGLFLRARDIMAHISRIIGQFDIRVGDIRAQAATLSGGNQQKVILAREFSSDPSIIVASQPMRGLDIGASEFVNRKLIEARLAGKAVLMVSSDLEEVLSLSDRVGVIYGGEIVAEFRPGDLDPSEIGEYMLGVKRAEGGEGGLTA
ncbi:MAG: ABC transporter ATP-binding protein, partial [Bacillota bacterium]